MPWEDEDASKKNHNVKTPEQQREWKDIANKIYKQTGDEGRAIREANGVLRKQRLLGGIQRPVDNNEKED